MMCVRAKLLRNVAMPETGSDVLQGETALTHVVMVTHAVETLVRRRGIQRARKIYTPFIIYMLCCSLSGYRMSINVNV